MTNKTSQATISTIGIDIGKNSFHVIGFDKRGAIVLRQKLSRGQIAVHFANLPSCLIGKGKKNSQQYVYNKRQDLRDKEFGAKYGGIPWTRFEKRIMANRPITKLGNFKNNMLDAYQVFYPKIAVPPENSHHWAFFADSCRHRGIEAALDHLPKELRPSYKEALDSSGDGFWQPDRIWSQWPRALKASGLLDFGKKPLQLTASEAPKS